MKGQEMGQIFEFASRPHSRAVNQFCIYETGDEAQTALLYGLPEALADELVAVLNMAARTEVVTPDVGDAFSDFAVRLTGATISPKA